MRFYLCLSLFSLWLGMVRAETVPDRAGAVRKDRATMEKDSRWIYNDWQRGLKEAAGQKKPLLVVLRCVPCLACAGIDASVLTDAELAPLLDRFVCVRLINANTLDLSLFQFDYDLSFSAMIFNGDGTIYGRYGSWTHQRDAYDKTIAGFKSALEGALLLHAGYPGNKTALSGKQGAPIPFKDPLEIPDLAGKYKRELDWEGKVVQSCVHCHQVGDAIRSHYRHEKKQMPARWIYPMPAAETIGVKLDAGAASRVQAVAAGTPAQRCGLQAGDEILLLEGQPIISTADVSWVLHQAPETGPLKAVVRSQDGTQRTLTLELPEGWRNKTDIARRVGTWPMRAMAFGGLQLEDLADAARSARGLDTATLALWVKHAGEYGNHAAAKKAGFQKGDVIVYLEGVSGRMTESELIGHLLRKHAPGDRVGATVLRGDKRLNLTLPIQ